VVIPKVGGSEEAALVSQRDNQALVAAILNGAFESPLWSTFLTKLRKLTAADFATMIFCPPGRPLGEALHLYAGDLAPHVVEGVYNNYKKSFDLLSDFGAEEGKIYKFSDLYPPKKSRYTRFYEEVVIPSGITVARMIRVSEPTGVSALLTISRRAVDFTARDNDLLKNTVAPVLQGALRIYVALERERFRGAVTGDAMRRLHFGWMSLDAGGRVLEHEAEAARVLSLSKMLARSPTGRLIARPRELHAEIMEAIRSLAGNPRARPRAIALSRDPWLDMLLLPATQNRLSANPRAAVIAYVHGDSWRVADRCDQLRQLFGLSAGEARLALALSRGMTIAEAAVKFELQIQTARKYSKVIYSKTGARGLPDLVRIVMRSVLAVAPER
jgi:DNA-binding CsgD family transcriptional regulator